MDTDTGESRRRKKEEETRGIQLLGRMRMPMRGNSDVDSRYTRYEW
jgi:hypothetical protein